MYKAKAHVGTDKLRILVRELRKKIISLGAEIRFSTCMTDIEISDGRVTAIMVEDNSVKKSEQNSPNPPLQMGYRIECDTLILAI
jgi:hypothetical protein